MHSNILPLRPNYTIADFAPAQVVTLRCTGRGGVPRYMHGDRAVVMRVTSSRIVVRNTTQQGVELRALPEHVECIVDEGGSVHSALGT
ncbi:MAG: hypothetical protein M3478_09140 [Planctomycetota bacterium]|nr:hypothetical protein [Planctomycetota bacterium]